MGKKDAIMFGTGEASNKCYPLFKKTYNIIAFSDNDQKKHHSFHHELPIIAPLDIPEHVTVIIASQWVIDIYNQLLSQEITTKENILVPPKKVLKDKQPFNTPNNLYEAELLLESLCTHLNKSGVKYWADFGTLLGLVRDNGIIPWDDDMDFSCARSDVKALFHAVDSFIKTPTGPTTLEMNEDIQTARKRNGFTITCRLTSKQSFLISFCAWIDDNDIYKHGLSNGLWIVPKPYFSMFTMLPWRTTEIRIPNDYHQYLTHHYGNWEIPNNAISFLDYKSLRISMAH